MKLCSVVGVGADVGIVLSVKGLLLAVARLLNGDDHIGHLARVQGGHLLWVQCRRMSATASSELTPLVKLLLPCLGNLHCNCTLILI